MGEAIGDIIKKLHRTGTLPALEAMRQEIPAGVLEMMSVPGLRPEEVLKLHQKLGLSSLAELEEAARKGRIRGVKGLGAAPQNKILQGLLKPSAQLTVSFANSARFGAALLWATGSVAHVAALQARAQERGLALGADGLRSGARTIAAAEETAADRSVVEREKAMFVAAQPVRPSSIDADERWASCGRRPRKGSPASCDRGRNRPSRQWTRARKAEFARGLPGF